jgi:Cu+-exporting ATPase
MFQLFKKNPKGTKLSLKITGMHCTSCSMNIDFAIEDLPGVHEAKTQYAAQKTIVFYEPEKVSKKKIIETINTLGYTVEEEI